MPMAKKTLVKLIMDYLAEPEPIAPLNLCVFGAPGSGKTAAVKGILEEKQLVDFINMHGITLAEPKTLNLAQLPSTEALARELANARTTNGSVPVIFFDEFDSALNGAAWGWLGWLLAPMNDGEFWSETEVEDLKNKGTKTRRVPLKRAIYIFAGGTASSYAEFVGFRSAEFRKAKGPDFVSRLMGFVDVSGLNDGKGWKLRRQETLDQACQHLAPPGSNTLMLSKSFKDALLGAGRFIHGKRSLYGALKMARAAGGSPLTLEHLPSDTILALHVDRGPLDPAVIGGDIALSSGGDGKLGKAQEPLVSALAKELWAAGACLSYGGQWRKSSITSALEATQSDLPKAFTQSGTHTQPWLRVTPPEDRDIVDRGWKPTDSAKLALGPGVSDQEHVQLNGSVRSATTEWLARSLALFRMRLQTTERSVARVCLGGKSQGYSGRMPGILEELMLSLAMGHPIYLIGGLGGTAQHLGGCLGLERPWRGLPAAITSASLAPGRAAALKSQAHLFRPPLFGGLPVDASEETLSWLTRYAVGGPLWPDNGLSIEENRELFGSTDQTRILELVKQGLLRRFAPKS